MVATSSYLNYYVSNRDKLFVPGSIRDDLDNTPYPNANSREKYLKAGIKYNAEPSIRDLVSVLFVLAEI